jgi:putative transposase
VKNPASCKDAWKNLTAFHHAAFPFWAESPKHKSPGRSDNGSAVLGVTTSKAPRPVRNAWKKRTAFLPHPKFTASSPTKFTCISNPRLLTSAVSQSLARNTIHLIFSTKDRRPILSDSIRHDLHAYATGILADEGCFLLAINSVPDHMHILFELNKNIPLSTAVKNIKQGTSRWLKTKSPDLHDFQWQAGYGAFSVSASNINTVTKYIARQPEHHQTRTFQDELRAFLRRHNIAFDEKYLWD